jgi:hypothetical protein
VYIYHANNHVKGQDREQTDTKTTALLISDKRTLRKSHILSIASRDPRRRLFLNLKKG